MNQEDYTGSDQTGFVVTVLTRAIEALDSAGVSDSHAEILDQLQRALDLEQDPNWQAFIVGLVGMLHERSGSRKNALDRYEDALYRADVTYASFDDTLRVYCQVAYYLGAARFDDEDYEGTVRALFHCLPWMWEIFDDLFVGNIVSYLALSLLSLGRPAEALPFARAAVMIREQEPGALTILQKVEAAWRAAT